MKDKLGGKIMRFAGLRPRTYVYIADDYEGEKKTKGAKKYIIKQELKIDDYMECLEND